MTSEILKQIIDSFKTQGKMNFLDAATEEQIAVFEKENSIQFPAQYKEWLQFSDGGECFLPAGIQFYGVAHKPIIDVNDSTRPNEKYIVIGALASGDPIVFEKEKDEISIYNLECNRIEDDEKYDNFYAFLKDLPGLLGVGE